MERKSGMNGRKVSNYHDDNDFAKTPLLLKKKNKYREKTGVFSEKKEKCMSRENDSTHRS